MRGLQAAATSPLSQSYTLIYSGRNHNELTNSFQYLRYSSQFSRKISSTAML